MPESLYEIVAYAMRYVFAALMALMIVPRAVKTVAKDLNKTRTLRRMMPETGEIGELLVTAGRGWARTGMRYPIIHEGWIGKSGRADVRIRHRSVARCHADFEWDRAEHALKLTCVAHAKVRKLYDDNYRSKMVLHDGDEFKIGDIRLQLVLNEAIETEPMRRGSRHFVKQKPEPIEEEPISEESETDDLFEVQDEYDDSDDGGDDYDGEA